MCIRDRCEAARRFEGTHDFKSFCSVNTAVEDTTRTIYSCELKQDGEVLTIRITGSGFLYNMVRIIAGTLFDVGIGKIAPEDIPAILEDVYKRQVFDKVICATSAGFGVKKKEKKANEIFKSKTVS